MAQECFENETNEKKEIMQLQRDTGSMNSIEQVRSAEQKAEEILSSASKEAELTIEDAKNTAERLIADACKTAKDRAAIHIAEAKRANRALMDQLQIDLSMEMQSLKDTALDATADAIELIYNALA